LLLLLLFFIIYYHHNHNYFIVIVSYKISIFQVSHFTRTGPVFASVAFVFMAFANIYATVCVSRLMLLAPKDISTLGDVGQWVFGRCGRLSFTSTQLVTCLLAPVAFLVLGSIFLEGIFPDWTSPNVWIILMASALLPVCLQATLKETKIVAVLGSAGVFLTMITSVSVLFLKLTPCAPSAPQPTPGFFDVIQTFGNLALAYGTAVV
jgi:vesicular inhibitory amino acid transporter